MEKVGNFKELGIGLESGEKVVLVRKDDVLTFSMTSDILRVEVMTMQKTLEKPAVGKEVHMLRKQLDLSQEEAAFILSVTTTTLSRWMNRKTVEPDPAHRNRLEMVLDLLREAKEVIKPDAIGWWFKTPHPLLNDLRPLDLLRSPSGFKKVKDLLFSMRWGLPA